ncbi:MAG: HD domain-containing phosphohydrolase, partial [Thiohalomonadaceae bacterium]
MKKRLDAVIRTAQYLATLDPRQDIWAELGNVALHIVDADLVAFAAPRHGRAPAFHHCAGDREACRHVHKAAIDLVQQVINSGFMVSEILRLDDQDYCTVLLPLVLDGKTAFVMTLGMRGSCPASRDTLNLYLAIAGLFSSTLTRLESQRRFLAMADNVPEMLFQLVRNPDGGLEFAYVSGGSRAALGFSPEQLIADPERFLSRLQADDRAEFERAMAGEARLHRIFRSTGMNGQEQYLLCNAMPSPREDGGIVWDGAIQDISEHRRLEEERRNYLERLENSMEATVQAIAHTIEKRDPYTAGHQRRVAALTRHLGEELGLSRDEVHGITLAASIHDIGKIHIPAEILSYPGPLANIEYELVKTHAQSGFEILKTTDFPWPVARMVLQHHERMDGSGYPNHLPGSQLLLGARIIAVADVVESMATFRPYRPALGVNAALAEIERNRNRL